MSVVGRGRPRGRRHRWPGPLCVLLMASFNLFFGRGPTLTPVKPHLRRLDSSKASTKRGRVVRSASLPEAIPVKPSNVRSLSHILYPASGPAKDYPSPSAPQDSQHKIAGTFAEVAAPTKATNSSGSLTSLPTKSDGLITLRQANLNRLDKLHRYGTATRPTAASSGFTSGQASRSAASHRKGVRFAARDPQHPGPNYTHHIHKHGITPSHDGPEPGIT